MALMRRRRPLWMMQPGEEQTPTDVWFDRPWQMFQRWLGEEFSPAVNFYEKEGKFYLTAELPGISKDDISINVENNVLTITGKKHAEREEEGADYYFKESSYGSFARSLRLPAEVEEDKIDASFKDGVLKLVMPHKETPTSHRIEIKSE
jgi:HSP20 family protein